MAMDLQSSHPYSLVLNIPFPTARLASIAQKAISVDKELSTLVQREFSVTSGEDGLAAPGSVLRVEYRATTNRMLRVATNSFMDSLRFVVEIMEKLDVDVLESNAAVQ